ncbi:MAG: serine--tRNA ligase [Candidatus Neomarinimicrobiota bacterium]|nr:serine--tRNA ligase [Candidatus Neomarinimicrobiota bacterium]|tara:strand:+ start:543 stop:1811 length:1269 start_codon:yes stop_codon:yes gene_type:complete
MISIDLIRNNLDQLTIALSSKGYNENLDEAVELDSYIRKSLSTANELRAERNKVSDQIALIKKKGGDAQGMIKSMREVGESIKKIENKIGISKEKLEDILLNVPNPPHNSVPKGNDEKENKVVSIWGEDISFNFDIKSHVEIGNQLGLFDFDQASKISGSGFPLYKSKGALLERGLINFMLDFQTNNNGYTEIFPPFLVNSTSALTTGNLPKFSEDMYHSEIDNLWLIPTAEVPITSYHRDQILSENQLPKKYAAFSACFRREAGSYGKETRGLLRVHQFNKVELVQFVNPNESYKVLEELTSHAEEILRSLKLKYRKVELCSGDLSFSAAKCFDLEVWSPAEEKWLEVSSCSNFEDFQARRGNIRYRKSSDEKVEFVHTLNGSGLATPRLMVALLETYQNKDGSVQVPDVLQDYIKLKIID